MTEFNIRLKEAMTARNFKQSDISALTGLDKSLISNYMSGRYMPKSNNLYLLAMALDVSEAWLMGYDVNPNRNAENDDLNLKLNEFNCLFNQLTGSQQELIIAQIKGILSQKNKLATIATSLK